MMSRLIRGTSSWCFAGVLLLLLVGTVRLGLAADPIVIDFEDENLDVWTFVDEPPENLGEQGPSSWEIFESQLGFENNVLMQNSNIWGEPEDHMLMGTIAYYNAREFKNFRLEVDVITNDNDGMGFVWGYQEDTGRHYRFQLMNDRWPELPPLDGFNGPYLIAHERISDSSPWYEVLAVVESDEYIPYTQGFEEVNHWILEVVDGAFTITTIDSFGDMNTMSGFDDTYQSGFVGIQLYAQSGVEFDNFTITPLESTVSGDFNADDSLSVADIDLLTQAILSGTNSAEFDLNSDQLVNGADHEVWVHNLFNTYYGDANLDGEFNSTDFVKVFQEGLFESEQPASWGQGDWNFDGKFNSSDFVKAFQDGGFETGPRQAVNAVPEPASQMLLLMGLIGWMLKRRRELHLN